MKAELSPGLVSIGLPVYNGARYLRDTLDSLVAQTYQNYEIILSDNASTDETEAICREFAARDPRVRYYRVEQNLGPFWNYKRVYELARGEYYMWNAHDDLRAPRCLELCVDAFRRNPDAVMCCMDTLLIDEEGREITDDPADYRIYQATGDTVYERLRHIAQTKIATDFYALFKTTIIPETRFGKIQIWGGDTVFTAEVCMRGDVIAVPEKLFHYRLMQSRSLQQMAAALCGWGADISVNWSGLLAELMESVRLAPLGTMEKIRLQGMLASEMCVRDPIWREVIAREGFRGVSPALRAHNFRRAARLLGIGMLSKGRRFENRVSNSLRYRAGRFKHRWLKGVLSNN
jgi:glycosyltransferase involved in cell wall biosynthesis